MSGPLAGSIVLVVEDEPLIAMDIARSFQDAGAKVLIARTLKDAMREIETPHLTAAVIDHALHDGITTSDVCERLTQLKIPFVVYSGFDHIEGACSHGEHVPKPASPGALLQALLAALNKHERPTLN